jgi:transcriptional regulator with XRE-family HTH domain
VRYKPYLDEDYSPFVGKKNLTQEHLAEDTGVSVDLISNIERGVNAPSFKTLEKLSTVLHVSPCELFDFEKRKGTKGRSTCRRKRIFPIPFGKGTIRQNFGKSEKR